MFSDLCPGDSNLENEGVAAHDAATYTYLIEMISADDGDCKAGERAEWQLRGVTGRGAAVLGQDSAGPFCDASRGRWIHEATV